MIFLVIIFFCSLSMILSMPPEPSPGGIVVFILTEPLKPKNLIYGNYSDMKKTIRVASVKDIHPGKGIKKIIKNESVAIFNYNGNFYALQNRCPHQNADLADGFIKNNQVFCPIHNWAFNIKTGAFAFNPEQKLKTYPVEIHGEDIYIVHDI